MKKLIFFLVFFLIGIVIFYWTIDHIGFQELKKAFAVLSCWQGVLILGLTVSSVLVGIWKWRELLKAEGVIIPFRSLSKYYLSSLSVAFFFPQVILGAEVSRGYLLREKSAVPGLKGIASALTDRILETTIFLIIIFFGVLNLFLKIGFHSTKLTLVAGVIFLILVLITILFYFKGFKKESIVKFIVGGNPRKLLEIEREMFTFLKPKKLLMLKIFSLNVLKATIAILRVWLLVIFLGKNIGFMTAVTILGFSYMAFLIPIPASLGSHEAAQVFVFNSLNLGAGAAPVFTMAIRVMDLTMALIGAIIFFRLGITLAKNTLYKKIDSFAENYDA